MLPCKIFKDFRLVKNIRICRSLGAYSVYKLFTNITHQPNLIQYAAHSYVAATEPLSYEY